MKLPYVTFNVPLLSRLLLGKIYAISIGLAVCEALGVGSVFLGVCYFQRGCYSRSVHTRQYVALTRRYDRPFLGKRSCNKLQQHVGETDRFVCTGDFLRKSVSKTELCRAAKSYTKSLRKSPFECVRPVCLFVCLFAFSISRFTNTQNCERKRDRLKLSLSPFVGRLSVGCLPTDGRQSFLVTVLQFYRSSSICAVWDVTGHRKNIIAVKLSCNTIE